MRKLTRRRKPRKQIEDPIDRTEKEMDAVPSVEAEGDEEGEGCGLWTGMIISGRRGDIISHVLFHPLQEFLRRGT